MTDNTDQNTQQQNTTPTPEDSGGKLFTQQQVNEIVRERLARQKEQLTQQTAIDERERALKEREEAFEAKETRAVKETAVRAYYESKGIAGKALDIAVRGSGAEIDALELEDGKIKDYGPIDGLIGGVFAGLVAKTYTVGAPVAHPPAWYRPSPAEDEIRNAFKPKI